MVFENRNKTRFSERAVDLIEAAVLAISDILQSLFGYEKDDTASKMALKTAGWFTRLGTYLVLDNGINVIHIGLAVTLKLWGSSLLLMFLLIWIFDFVVAGAFIVYYETTGKDLSLGADLRRTADKIRKKSATLGFLITFWNTLLSIVWFGPERVLTYHREEIGSGRRLIGALVFLTSIQAFLWATLYSYAYDFVRMYL